MRARAWTKTYDSWYTTRSHIDLGGVALNIGPRLQSLANASPDRGWLLAASGRPLTPAVIARETRFPEDLIVVALGELIDCGTLVKNEAGAYGFPNFLLWQEDRSTDWKRKARESKVGAVVESGVEIQQTFNGEFNSDSTIEDRGQRSEDQKTEDQRTDQKPEEMSDAVAPDAAPLVFPSKPNVRRRRVAPTHAPPASPELEAAVDAWNYGRDGTRISRAASVASGAAPERDKRLRVELGRYPPDAWEWCARALATSEHHCGANGWGPADLPWLLESRNRGKLEHWMSKGAGLRDGTWSPPQRVEAPRRQTYAQRAAQMAIEERERENARQRDGPPLEGRLLAGPRLEHYRGSA